MNHLSFFKILLFWVGLIGSGFAQTAYADTQTPSNGQPAELSQTQRLPAPSHSEILELSLMGGFSIYNTHPSGINFTADGVYGGDARVIFESDSILSVGASVGCRYIPGSRTSIDEGYITGNPPLVYSDSETIFEFLFSQKLNFGKKRSFRPYLLGGLGLDLLEAISFELHPVAQLGAGFEFPIGKSLSFFAEVKGNLVLSLDIVGVRDATFIYAPLDAGITCDF